MDKEVPNYSDSHPQAQRMPGQTAGVASGAATAATAAYYSTANCLPPARHFVTQDARLLQPVWSVIQSKQRRVTRSSK